MAFAWMTGSTTGAINGWVADNTGAVLPGVIVTLSSPALMGTQTSVTDAQGLYRFPSVPPGEYRLVYELTGFMRLVREGIRVGSSAGTQSGYSAYGTTRQNRPVIEGMLMQQINTGSSGATFYYDYGSFGEISVNAAANGADMPTPGIQMQFISKSGGNEFHGGVYADYENQNIQSHNITAGQVTRGARDSEADRLFAYRDLNVDAGGPFKNGWVGNHNFKFGGAGYRDTGTEYWTSGWPGSLVMVFNNGVPIEVYTFLTPQVSSNGLWVYSAYANDNWNAGSRLTLNIGARFDRYRSFLPAQDWPASRFHPVAEQFGAVDNVNIRDLWAPRPGRAFSGHSRLCLHALRGSA